MNTATMPMNPETKIALAGNCSVCQTKLTIRATNWWHKKHLFRPPVRRQKEATVDCASERLWNDITMDDLCTQHYWRLSRGQRKCYFNVTEENAIEALGSGSTSFEMYMVGNFDNRWWAGRGKRIAVFCGGGWFKNRPYGGGPIQACDKDSVSAITDALTDAGFDVIEINIDTLGNPTSRDGEEARSDLLSCQACVVPGGDDVAQAASLGETGKAALQKFLWRCREEEGHGGNGIVGICAGAWLLGYGDSKLSHNYRWIPVECDPEFGDNGLEAMVSIEATDEGVNLLGNGLDGDVYFDESPRMMFIVDKNNENSSSGLISPNPATYPNDDIKALATYGNDVRASSFMGAAALRRMGKERVQQRLSGGIAVVAGLLPAISNGCNDSTSLRRPRPRFMLIGPHWEVTPTLTTSHDTGDSKEHVVVRAVAWAAGLKTPGSLENEAVIA